ncbi:hypothetical protein J6590_106813, partial [Homalodisca vitripennis]
FELLFEPDADFKVERFAKRRCTLSNHKPLASRPVDKDLATLPPGRPMLPRLLFCRRDSSRLAQVALPARLLHPHPLHSLVVAS